MKSRIPSVAVVLLSLACNDGIRANPAMPSQQIEPIQIDPLGGPTGGVKQQVDLSMWSPYIVVHTPGEALRAYQKVIPELMASGALRGVRIGIYKGEGRNFVNAWISSVVPDVLWILDNYYLFDPNIEDVIDQVFSWYPTIHYLQIGNETTTILPKAGPQIPIEMYMEVFEKINAYVQRRYPGVVLLTQSTFGSGSRSSVELERMIELGLKEITPRPIIIVSMNVYSISNANQNSYVVNSSLRGYRIWVTESGVNDPSRHIGYVQRVYPFIRNTLRAERIYWYCLYCGESGGDSGFGLIRDIMALTIWTSLLYNALTGR